MEINTKLSLNQEVWAVSTKRAESWKTCETCDGKGVVTVKEKSFGCPECYARGGEKVYSDKQQYYIYGHGIIGNVLAEFYSEKYENDDEIKYMLDITGVGSGTLWSEDKLFESEKDAEKYCAEMNN
jgi:protein-arginine kinase activator protein McsA